MPMKIGTQMPSLDGATEWFGGTEQHAIAEAQGHTTLVHFWSVSCDTCKDNMPRVAEWRDARRDEGLRVIAVHMPRMWRCASTSKAHAASTNSQRRCRTCAATITSRRVMSQASAPA